MHDKTNPWQVSDLETLEALYETPAPPAKLKEIDYIHPHYRAFIEAAPFAVLATSGPGGLDASPRGDPAGFVVVEDEKTLLIPDRKGNNRVDSLRNILVDPRVALLFLIPGIGETLRINGRAMILINPSLLERFPVGGKLPRSVLVVQVETVFFQCSRAILRSKLWDGQCQLERDALPSTGTILQDLSDSAIDASAYDRNLPARLKTSMY
jgi:PPOX class probable FMN-dependent enzyme